MYIRRKVYSDVDYDYGYDYDYDEPRYYSVIMDEDELALFSDLQEYLYSDEGDTGSAVGAALGGLGAAAAMGGAYAGMKSDRFKDYVAGLDKKAASAAKAKKAKLGQALQEEIKNINSNNKIWDNLSHAEQDAYQKKIYDANVKGLESKIKLAQKKGQSTAVLQNELDALKAGGYRNVTHTNRGSSTLKEAYNRGAAGDTARAIDAATKANQKAIRGIKDKSTLSRLVEWGKGNKKTALAAGGAAALGAAALGSGIGRSVNRRRD